MSSFIGCLRVGYGGPGRRQVTARALARYVERGEGRAHGEVGFFEKKISKEQVLARRILIQLFYGCG